MMMRLLGNLLVLALIIAAFRLLAVSLFVGALILLLIGIFTRPAESFGLLLYFLVCALVNEWGLRFVLPAVALMALGVAVRKPPSSL